MMHYKLSEWAGIGSVVELALGAPLWMMLGMGKLDFPRYHKNQEGLCK
jgi:hypothetical protein